MTRHGGFASDDRECGQSVYRWIDTGPSVVAGLFHTRIQIPRKKATQSFRTIACVRCIAKHVVSLYDRDLNLKLNKWEE